MEGLSGHICSQVAAAKDHTVVLTEDGCVYTFGLNIFHQLGIIPPPSSCNVPRQVNSLNNKVTICYKIYMDKKMEGIDRELILLTFKGIYLFNGIYFIFHRRN